MIAILGEEPGHERLAESLDEADTIWISTVNLSEVVSKLVARGAEEAEVRNDLATVGLAPEAFDEGLALAAGLLRPATRSAGLSLGDRACLALAMRLNAPAITTDRAWAELPLSVAVIVAR